MKYIRDTINYFRESDERIESAQEISRLAKEQTARETVDKESFKITASLAIISVIILAVIIGLIYAGITAINSMDNPDDLFDNPAVLYGFIGIFMLVGILLTFFPIGRAIALKIKCKEEAQGRCIGFDDKTVVTKRHSYVVSCPVYTFTANGQDYKVYDRKYLRRNISSYIGEQLPISFDPNDPNNCIINGKSNWYSLYIILGVVFLTLALIALIASLTLG